MIEFNSIIHGERPLSSLSEICHSFRLTYQDYISALNGTTDCHISANNPQRQNSSAVRLRTQLADLAIDSYRQSRDYNNLGSNIDLLLEDTQHANPTNGEEDKSQDSTSQNHKWFPSPADSIITTAQNLEVASHFVDRVSRHKVGMLLSGAHAWGPFFAVHRGASSQSSESFSIKPSDIDFLVTYQTDRDLRDLIEDFADNELIPPLELERYQAFKKLKSTGEADLFSVRSYFGGVEESVHFMSSDLVERVCTLQPLRIDSETGIEYANDLRPNIPGNVTNHGGYPTGDLKGKTQPIFVPKLEQVLLDEYTPNYISQTTVGGLTSIDHEASYFIGVLSFYLLIAPTILVDNQVGLYEMLTTYRKNIARLMNGKSPAYIPRQEKMPTATLERIKDSLR